MRCDWKIGTLVPLDSEPFQSVENPLHELRPVAFYVGVLDSQKKRAAFMAGEEPVEQGSPRAAHVEIAGRRRSKSHARLFGLRAFLLGSFLFRCAIHLSERNN